MRIAHVLAPAPFGGLEQVVLGLATGLARRDHEVHAIALLEPTDEPPPWLATLEQADVHLHRVHASRRGYLSEARAVRAVLAEHDVEILHTHGDRADLIHGALAAPRACHTVSTVHGFARNGRWAGLAERIHAQALQHLDAVVAVSHALRERLVGEGIAPDRLFEIVNGASASLPPLERREARAGLGLPPNVTVVGWVGRLSEEKAPMLAVEALAALRRPEVQLVFVGDGPERAATEARAADFGIGGQVHCLGPHPDAGRLLRAFDVLLLTSRSEGTPIVLLEAAAAEVPIVATAVGGVPEMLGTDALLTTAGDALAIARALQLALDDPASAQRRAVALRRRLEHTLLSERWIDEYARLYARLASGDA